MSTKRFFIHLAYSGAGYCGWQCQPQQPSIQEDLEKGLSLLFRTELKIVGAGRTDSGVNALQYYAHFDIEEDVLNDYIKNTGLKNKTKAYSDCVYRLNALLGKNIAVYDLFEVEPSELHARFSAIQRTYHYYIHTKKNPFVEKQSMLIYKQFNVEKIREALPLLLGRHDFSSFEKVHSQVKTHICTITRADLLTLGGDAYVFVFSADRFLRNMVRAMVGSLLDIGEGKYSPSHIQEIMDLKDRSSAGKSVPGYALYLKEVKYF